MFIANIYGVELGIGGYLTVIAMSVLASIGTAGVPGVGNVSGDAVVSTIVAKSEGKLDLAVYADPNAGVTDGHLELDEAVEVEMAQVVEKTHNAQPARPALETD